jgi:hypothetical protein
LQKLWPQNPHITWQVFLKIAAGQTIDSLLFDTAAQPGLVSEAQQDMQLKNEILVRPTNSNKFQKTE